MAATVLEGEELELASGHRLEVERGPSQDVVRIVGREGLVSLRIEVTNQGLLLRFEAAALELKAAHEISLDAGRLTLRGRDGVDIASGADAVIRADGDLRTEASAQSIRARLGGVDVTANDDVRLTGERIRLNC